MGNLVVAWAAVATVTLRLSEIAIQIARWRRERRCRVAPVGEIQQMPLTAVAAAGSTSGAAAASVQVSCRRGAVTVTAVRAEADR